MPCNLGSCVARKRCPSCADLVAEMFEPWHLATSREILVEFIGFWIQRQRICSAFPLLIYSCIFIDS